MICGHCKDNDVTVAHVRGCKTGRPAVSRSTAAVRRARMTLDDLYDDPFTDSERCARCSGTGMFITACENGKPIGPGGPCFRCAGKGRQSDCGTAAHATRVLLIANGEQDMTACCDRVRNDLYDRFGIRVYL